MFQHWGSQLHYPQDTSLKIRGLTRPDKSWTKINNENVQALGFASQLRVFWRNLRGLYAESRESQTEAQHQLKMHMEKLNFIQLLSSFSIELEWTVKADRFEICFCTQWKDLPFPKKRPGLCKTSSLSGIASYDSKSRGLLPEAISMVINGPKHPWIKKRAGLIGLFAIDIWLTHMFHISWGCPSQYLDSQCPRSQNSENFAWPDKFDMRIPYQSDQSIAMSLPGRVMRPLPAILCASNKLG